MSVRVDHGRLLDVLTAEGQLLTAATHDVRGERAVPGPSGRTLSETVRHLGDLCDDTLSWLGTGPRAGSRAESPNQELPDQERPNQERPSRELSRRELLSRELPADASLRELTGRLTARLAELLAEFTVRPPEEPCATWWPEEHTTSFWVRRMVHATTVARVDVQTAADVERTDIDPDIAVDGIDEVLRVWLDYRLHSLGIKGVRTGSVEVAAAGHRWRVSTTPQRTSVFPDEEGGRPASARLGGQPWAVYLWLCGRLPDRSVETSGDPDVLAQLWGLLRLATQ